MVIQKGDFPEKDELIKGIAEAKKKLQENRIHPADDPKPKAKRPRGKGKSKLRGRL
jgi:hypothetical protein